MAAPHERHQQVHRNGAAGRVVANPADRIAKLSRGRQAQRAEATGGGHSSGQLRARQAATHAGLGNRDIQAEPIKQIQAMH